MNRSTCILVLAAVVLGDSAQSGAPEPSSSEQRLHSILDEAVKMGAEFRAAQKAIKDPAELQLLNVQFQTRRTDSQRRLLALAKEDSRSKAAPKALGTLLASHGRSPEELAAIEQLRRDWLVEPEVAFACIQMQNSPIPQVEPLLRDIISQNPDRTSRGLACYALARYLENRAKVAQIIDPDERTVRKWAETYGPENVAIIRQRHPDELWTEVEALFDRVVREYADLKMYLGFDKGYLFDQNLTIGKSAGEWLAQHRELQVGMPAFEIDGKTLDGQPRKLSQYRGKVVVLVFWGSWCPPCVAMIPHEKELIKRLEGKPFAFLGFNTDQTEARALKFITEEQLTWPNWFAGSNRQGGIADRFHVHSFPTTFVLDGNGIIRARNVHGPQLDEAVDKLLVEMAR